MKIFAIDTTAGTASVALLCDDKLLAEYSMNTNTHSTTLLPMINSVLSLSDTKVAELDLLAVSAGPGSFTGVRIGVSTIKGMAFSDQIPCVGVSSLCAMAMNFTGIAGLIVPVINARNFMVYTSLFDSDGVNPPVRISPDEQISIVELFEKLKNIADVIHFTGDAYGIVMSNPHRPFMVSDTPEKLRNQSAYGVGIAAAQLWNSTEDKSVFSESRLHPIYLKKSQAEREREEKTHNTGESN